MKKLLIVGHHTSNYKTLEEMLNLCGMSEPSLSYAYKMTPQELTLKLVQSGKLKQSANSDKYLQYRNKERNKARNTQVVLHNEHTSYAQVYPSKLWDALVLDLMLANSESPLWGWSDPKAVKILEYLAELDEDMMFVLTYDKPHHVIMKSMESVDNVDDLNHSLIEEQIQDWLMYNQALLAFQKKYPERCLLVNGEQVVHSAQKYIASVAQKLTWQIDQQAIDTQLTSSVMAKQAVATCDLTGFFVEQILAQNSTVQDMFLLLQQNADMSLVNPKSHVDSALELLKQAIGNQSQLHSTKELLQSSQSEMIKYQQKAEKAEQDNHKIVCQFDKARQQLQEVQQENSLVITQLHQVQEELEKYYLDNQSTQEKLKIATEEAKVAKQLAETQKQQAKDLAEAKAKAEKVANEHKKQLEALNQSKQTLEKQLNEQKQQQQASQDVQQENELLITQLHQVQEELEKYYLENQRLKAEQEMLREPVKPIYYGAADRVKQDLPYRLGSTMVNHSKSTKDLAKLPFALAQEYREFQKQQDVQGELPPVEEYQDSHEAEKVKKHLSYRLGKTLVDGVKSPKEILGLPAKLGREIVGFGKK